MQDDPFDASLLDALLEAVHPSPTEEAAIGLISDAGLLAHPDFTERFITRGDDPGHARVNWTAAVEAVDRHDLPASDTACYLLRVAASLAAGIPINLQVTVGALDDVAGTHVMRAIRIAN